jgi:hypothetical protein
MKLWNYLSRIRVLRNSCLCENLYASCNANSAGGRPQLLDVYHRTRYYPQPLAFIPGLEGAGTIEAVVQDVRSGSTVLTIQPTVYRSFP